MRTDRMSEWKSFCLRWLPVRWPCYNLSLFRKFGVRSGCASPGVGFRNRKEDYAEIFSFSIR